MKKNIIWGFVVSFFCSALALGTLTSCHVDEDVETSVTLSGDWYGDFGMYYDYFNRKGDYVDRFYSYDTDVSFYPDHNYATYGYGYQVDYYKHGPYKKIYHYFEWEIRYQNIYLYYPGDEDYNTIIRDYSMSHHYFTGYFNNGTAKFRLEKYNDYYDWDPYWDDFGPHGWGYYEYDNWYYGMTRANGAVADSAAVEDLKGGTIRMGNRFEK